MIGRGSPEGPVTASQFDRFEADRLGAASSYQPETADLQLLAEIGLSAAVKGGVEGARPIFEALSLWRPDHPVATIGMGLALVSDGEFDAAIDLLKPALQANPTSSEVAAVLLIALTLAGRLNEARQIRKTLLNGPDGPGKMIAVRLASVLDG